jgi:hypothetical protein
MNDSGNKQAQSAIVVVRRGERVQALPGSVEQGHLDTVTEVFGEGDPDCIAVVRLDNGHTVPLKLSELTVIRGDADLLPPGAVPVAGDLWDGPRRRNRAVHLRPGRQPPPQRRLHHRCPGWIGPPVMRVVDRTVLRRPEPASVRVRLASQGDFLGITIGFDSDDVLPARCPANPPATTGGTRAHPPPAQVTRSLLWAVSPPADRRSRTIPAARCRVLGQGGRPGAHRARPTLGG